MSTSTFPNLPGVEMLGQQIEISRIERELQNMFLVDDPQQEDDNAPGIARASLLNLALYNENQEQLATDAEALQEVTLEAACRAILIHTNTEADRVNATAWIQANCQIVGSGQKQVCTEQVSFYLEGRAPGLVRNIVFAHLDSDLPLAFWWRGEFSDVFEERLYSRIDRFIFDSECWDSPRNQFLRLQEAENETSWEFVAHDLAYTRLNSIRSAISKTFDRPSTDHRKESIEKIMIRFAVGHRMSGVYLVAWIASRLGLNLDDSVSHPGKFVFTFSTGQVLEIELGEIPADRKGCVEVDFHMGNQKIEVSRCQTKAFLRTLITRADTDVVDEDWLPHRGGSDASLVTQILIRAGRNRTYTQLLPLVGRLLAV